MVSVTRRSFLQTSALAAVTAGYTATARGYAANETIRVGCIGTGGRCRKLMQSLQQIPGVKLVAVCDIWETHLAEGRKLADPAAIATPHYESLLERNDVDAVVIGTPDHWHVPMTIAACQAGKDVYVEKPLTHDLTEGAAVVAAQNEHRRIVQVGTQQRSMPHIQKAYELVRSGALGPIHKVDLSWNRNSPRANRPNLNIDPKTVDWKRFLGSAPQQPFDEYRFRQWRWFWDFGGGIFTDLMVHWIDVVHWFIDADHPQLAMSVGQFQMARDLWETPDTVQTLMTYPEQGVQAHFEGTFSNARHGARVEFEGTEGTLYIDRGGYQVFPDRNKKLPASEWIIGSGPRGADFYDQPDGETLHLANWLECVRTRSRPLCPAEAGVSAASAAHLANLSLRRSEAVRWQGA